MVLREFSDLISSWVPETLRPGREGCCNELSKECKLANIGQKSGCPGSYIITSSY